MGYLCVYQVIYIMKTLEERFLSKINKTETCWLWTKYKNKKGYGQFAVTSNNIQQAHRISYELYYGEFDNNLFVCHKCDNPSCVNPDHLFLGTPQDNMTDKVKKSRQSNLIGSYNPNHKLIEEDIIEIKNLLLSGMKQKEIAQKYNVDRMTIYYIKYNKTWKHIK